MTDRRPLTPAMVAERERVRVARAVAILGVEARTVQALAARGELPGAAKIGGTWTFNEAALRTYIEERTSCPKSRRLRNTRTGEAMSSGRALSLLGRKSEKASEQALSRLLRGA